MSLKGGCLWQIGKQVSLIQRAITIIICCKKLEMYYNLTGHMWKKFDISSNMKTIFYILPAKSCEAYRNFLQILKKKKIVFEQSY